MIAANRKVEHRDLQEKKAIDEASGAVFTDWQTEENLSKFGLTIVPSSLQNGSL